MGTPANDGQARYVAPQLTVRVLDGQTAESTREIYVLYRVAPPPAEPEEQGLLHYLRSLVVEDGKPAPRPFGLGVTNKYGYLLPVTSTGASESVESLKLTPDIAYEIYLIRHPDPRLARAIRSELDGEAPRVLTEGWPSPHVLTPSVEGVGTTEEQLTLRLPSSADAFLPPGPARYGGWTLYKDMPHASQPAVRDAVKRLQLDLGALRYVVGAYPPYEPEVNNEKGTNPTANVGVFDARTMSAVLGFQRQALAGAGGQPNAFVVADKSKAHAQAVGKTAVEASYAYLKGKLGVVPPPSPAKGERALLADGVVDAITGRALQVWLDAGCRRPGHVLVGTRARVPKPIGWWDVWLRDDAADALQAWRELTIAMGCPTGIAANHTYRTPLQDVGKAGYGRSPVSIHKTGLAIDVGVKNGFLEAVEEWPVAFERDARDAKSEGGVVVGHRVRWRLFASSSLPVDVAVAASELRARFDVLAGQAGIVGPAASALRDQLDDDAEIFFATWFRSHVTQWIYDPYDDDGGTPGSPLTPAERYSDPRQTRWLDITELGELCLLQRIGSFTNKLKPTGSDWGLAGTQTKPSTVAKLSSLAKAISGAQAQVDDPVTLMFEGRVVPLADLRANALIAYADALPAFYNDATLKGFSSVAGPKLTIKLSWSPSGRKAVEAAASALEGLEIPLMVAEVDATPRTGAEWATWLRERVEELQQQAPAQQVDGGKAATTKPPQRLTLYPVIAEHRAADGTVTPLRVLDTATITHPAPGSPIGMEWWHFQRTDLVSQAKTFGKLLLELGWTEEGLLDTPSSVTHGRTGVGYPRSELDKVVG